MKFKNLIKNVFGIVAFLSAVQAYAADLTITAANTNLTRNQTTTVTFTFRGADGALQPVTGFDINDVILDNGGSISGFSGSGAVYTATYTKTDINQSAIRVNIGSYSPSGAVIPLGFNVSGYYLRSGTAPNFTYTLASPQPSCGLDGQILTNPSTRLVEQYYVIFKSSERNTNFYRAVPQGCLVRLQAGQQWIRRPTPTPLEAANVHGGHNHTTNMPKIKTDKLPRNAGVSKYYVRPQNHPCNRDTNAGHCAQSGDFRTSFLPSHFSNDDPIVFPGQPGATHSHVYFGNTTIDWSTNNANIKPRALSNANGGLANKSGYWAPSMIDVAKSTILVPKSILLYYKSEAFGTDFGQIEAIPANLKIVAGNPQATTPQPTNRVRYTCYTYTGAEEEVGAQIGNCFFPRHTLIRMQVNFPRCVADNGSGGMVLDSPNHQSHTAFDEGFPGMHSNGFPLLSNHCPSSHPHRITGVAQLIDYEIKKGDNTRTWRLSSDNYSMALPGGRSAHADYWFAWDPVFINKIVNNCNNAAIDCAGEYIGLNAGIPIASITTVGNVATVTTVNPHRLPLNGGGALPWPANFAGNRLRVRISGVTGVEAFRYNFDPTSPYVNQTRNGVNYQLSVGTQEITILNATQFTYNTNGTPSNTTVNVSNALVQWGEELCRIDDTCPIEYGEHYYR